ncbi:hypothetical protein INT80_06485 [Gallibacterium anatis]|uniref:Uncharacterized protein n=1 Tax=Gallibacterium anatis TaxID=750 RepID=A0A930UTT0_9PAST|nr:hypothetical protein [Gallibacterium anatis]
MKSATLPGWRFKAYIKISEWLPAASVVSFVATAHRGYECERLEPQNGLKIANVSRSYSGAGVGDTSTSSATNGLQDTTAFG